MSSASSHSDRPAISAKIRAAAAEWLVRREEGLAASEQTALAQWLKRDERHARALAEVSRSSHLFDGLTAPETARVDVDRSTSADSQNKRRVVFAPWLAAAALIALTALWWLPRFTAHHVESATTEIGHQRNLSLPDSSVVTLNTDSSIEVAFSASERRIELLRGEAYFRVAKNPQRPFLVTARHVTVRAVGTAFNVRVDPAAVEVLVTEGKVRLNDTVSGKELLTHPIVSAESHATEPTLAAGQRAVIPASSGRKIDAPAIVEAVPSEETERTLAWQEQRLVFVSAPLREVVAQFNRYNRHKLVLEDSRLNDLRFGGRFRPEAYDEFVQLLETNFGITAERRDAETLLRQSP